jgi:hypothetical protein
VIAVGLFDFLICFWLIGLLFLKWRCRLWWGSIYHFCITWLLFNLFRLWNFWLTLSDSRQHCILVGNIDHVSISVVWW